MSEFKKGQLVAVCDDDCSKKFLWIYDHASPEGLHFCRSPNRMIGPRWWRYAVPAEEVWSDIFLACDRGTIESHNRAIDWLCEQLDRISQDTGHCMLPSGAGIPSDDSCRVGGCESCWRMAAVKAVKEDADGA